MKKIYKHKIILFSVLAVIFMAAGNALQNSSGAPASYTNAPGEANCTSCHSSFSLNPTSSNLSNLTMNTTFTGGGYIPDSTYTITVTYSQSGINLFGFEVTSLTKAGSAPAGTFTAGSGSQKTTGTVAGKTREYLTHTYQSTSGSRTWVFSWKAPSTNVDTIIFYVVMNAANSNGSESGDEIYAKSFKFGPSSLLPIAKITADKTTICVGDTVKFSGSSTNNPLTFNWKFNGNPSTSTSQNVNVVYNSAGTYFDSLKVTNAKGTSAVGIKITVANPPTASIVSVVPGNTICSGDTTVITANFGTGFKYSWNTGVPADTLQTLKVTQSGNYKVTVKNAGGCATTSSGVNIVVNPRPTVTLSSTATNDSTCVNDSVTFTATPGLVNYVFSVNSTSKQNGAGNTFKTKLVAGDVVSVVGTNATCSSNPVAKIITVVGPSPAPTISCGTSTTSSVTFNWTAVSGATGYEVSKDTGKTWTAPSSGSAGTSHTINGLGFSTTVQLMVRASVSNLCGKSLTGTASCSTLSCSGVTFVSKVKDTVVCKGDSTSITISNISVPKFSIKFNNGAFVSDTVFWVKPTANTTYPFEILDSAKLNCGSAPFTATVKVETPGAITLTFNPSMPVCSGKPLQVTANTASTFVNYNLQLNNSTVQTQATKSFVINTPVNKDSVRVVGNTALGCKSFSSNQAIAVSPSPKPGFTATVNNKVVTFDDTTSTTANRIWNFGDNSPIETQKNPNHTYATVGIFNVKLIVLTGNACVDSVTKQITTANVGIDELNGMNGFSMYPNPTTGKVELNFDWQGEGSVKLVVTDITGKTVINDEITAKGAQAHTLNLQHLPGGTYLLYLQTANGEKTYKILKQDK